MRCGQCPLHICCRRPPHSCSTYMAGMHKGTGIRCRYCGSGEAFDNIYVERDIATWEDLDERLRRMEHFIQNPPGPPLRLVVIDSVAHLFSDNADFQTGR